MHYLLCAPDFGLLYLGNVINEKNETLGVSQQRKGSSKRRVSFDVVSAVLK
jgi:hypothetical protein